MPSTYWLSSSTPSFGCRRRSSIAARTPSSRNVGGIRTSSTATSGAVCVDLGEQRVGVAVGADRLEPGLVEEPHEPLAQQHGVLGEHDAQGAASGIRHDLHPIGEHGDGPDAAGVGAVGRPMAQTTPGTGPACASGCRERHVRHVRADRGRAADRAVDHEHAAQAAHALVEPGESVPRRGEPLRRARCR